MPSNCVHVLVGMKLTVVSSELDYIVRVGPRLSNSYHLSLELFVEGTLVLVLLKMFTASSHFLFSGLLGPKGRRMKRFLRTVFSVFVASCAGW